MLLLGQAASARHMSPCSRLSWLGRPEGAALVRELVGDTDAVPAEVVDEIIERTGDVPLFLIDVTKLVLV